MKGEEARGDDPREEEEAEAGGMVPGGGGGRALLVGEGDAMIGLGKKKKPIKKKVLWNFWIEKIRQINDFPKRINVQKESCFPQGFLKVLKISPVVFSLSSPFFYRNHFLLFLFPVLFL